MDEIKKLIGDESKDIRVNFSNILDSDYLEGFDETKKAISLLSCLYALKNPILIKHLEPLAKKVLDEKQVFAIKQASSLMFMNNIYYRFIHFSEDSELSKMPAKLRMTAMATHGIDKIDFELSCLIVSALNGCGMCVKSHTQSLKKLGLGNEAILSAIRMASVLKAVDYSIS